MTKQKLTAQQKMFVYSILQDMNQTDSYISGLPEEYATAVREALSKFVSSR